MIAAADWLTPNNYDSAKGLRQEDSLMYLRLIVQDALLAGTLLVCGFTKSGFAHRGNAVAVDPERLRDGSQQLFFDDCLVKARNGETILYGVTVERAATDGTPPLRTRQLKASERDAVIKELRRNPLATRDQCKQIAAGIVDDRKITDAQWRKIFKAAPRQIGRPPSAPK